MPKEIVKNCRQIYEKYFDRQTLLTVPKALIKTQAFDGELGFPGSYITVNFAGDPHDKINAANIVMNQNGTFQGYIYANSELGKVGKEMRKFILAEEWIELMMGFRAPKVLHKRIQGKIHLAVLFNTVKRRGFWQDTPDEHGALLSALRALLVPRDRLEELAVEMFEKRLNALKVFADVSPQEAQSQMESLVLAYAAKHYVDRELVWDRLMAFMFDGHVD